jgi:hypothetical protein
VHDTIQLERRRVPTVSIVSKSFEEDTYASARAFGMPDLPFVVVPETLSNRTEAEIVKMADAVIERIVELLVSPEANAGGKQLEKAPELLEYSGRDQLAALDAFQEDYLKRGWGDGFPLVIPTEARVKEMLRGTSHSPDEVVCTLEPGNTLATIEKIAINSVMAGCKPEYLPVVLAAVEAMSDPLFLMRIVACSTGMHAPCTIVNGPYGRKIGVNSGRAALGPGVQSRANLAIGRAVRLILMNVGHAYVGELDLDTIGSPRKISMCYAENEAENPWEPLHVRHGFKKDESTVTMFGVTSEVECLDFANTTGEGVLHTFAGTAIPSGTDGVYATFHKSVISFGHIMMLISTDHALVLKKSGFTPESIRKYMFENARREYKWLGSNQGGTIDELEENWREIAKKPETLVPITRTAEHFHMVVVGGSAGKSQVHLGAGTPITRSIDKWL